MTHWSLHTATQWERLSGCTYGQFFDKLQDQHQRTARDLAILLACEDYNNDPAIDIDARLLEITCLPMGEVIKRISEVFSAEKKTAD